MSSKGPGEVRLERALLAVDDKTGIADLAQELASLGIDLWATGGTRAHLSKRSVAARPLEEITGVGSWFDGRVKTLHPAVFGGILASRTRAGLEELAQRMILPIDLVVVNFYPFERRVAEAPAAPDREEFVDIGGVSLARAAAKNHAYVTILSDPTQYTPLLDELRSRGGRVSSATRRDLAIRAFERTAQYDAAIASGLGESGEPFPRVALWHRDELSLRYGENPHQKAACYLPGGTGPFATMPEPFELVKGDPPSFTNLLDLDAAARIAASFSDPSAAVVKHATPCGAASASTLRAALEGAVATDPVARYGCAIATNRPVTAEDVEAVRGVFVDLLAAPEFQEGALERLASRKKVKLLRLDPGEATAPGWEARSALGRLLVQEPDRRPLEFDRLRLVTGPPADAGTLASLAFAWEVVRHAKSNAIVLARGRTTVGIGSGQPTRVKAVELACEVAGPRAKGSVLASDAFFPFSDGVEAAGRAGVTAIIQPGGSLRDPEVIAAAERYGISMYFTGWRVFRH